MAGLGEVVVVITANADEFIAKCEASAIAGARIFTDANTGAQDFERNLDNVGKKLDSTEQKSGSLLATLLKFAAATSPFIALSTLSIAATAAVGAISLIGPAASLEYVNVRKAFAPLKKDLETDFASLGDSFAIPMINAAHALRPALDQTSAALRPSISSLAPSFNSFIQLAIAELPKLAKAFDPVIQAAGPLLNSALKSLPGIFDSINHAVAGFGGTISKYAPDIKGVFELFGVIGGPLKLLFTVLANVGQQILPKLLPMIDQMQKQLGPQFQKALTQVGDAIVKVADALIKAAPAFADVLGYTLDLVGPLSTMVGDLAPLAPYILAVWAATKLWAAAQFVLDTALDLNPIGAVIVAVAALSIGIYEAYEHSETFRKGLDTFVNFISGTAIAVFKLLADAVVDYGKIALQVPDAIAHAWSHLPDFLGGGWANNAAKAIDGMIHDLDGLQSTIDGLHGTNLTVGVNVKLSDNGSPIGSNNLSGQLSGAQAAAAQLAQGGVDQALINIQPPSAPSSVTSGGVGPSPKASSSSASAAKTAQKALAADLAAVLKNISTDTADQIKTVFDKLNKDLVASGHSALLAISQPAEKSLMSLAKTLNDPVNGVNKQLTDAQANLKTITDASAALYKSVHDGVVALSDTTSANGFQTIASITDQMKLAVDQSNQFNAALTTLGKEGLNKDTLNQLINAGPAQGLSTATALLQGGQAGVDQVNSLNKQLNAAADGLSKTSTDAMFAAGISMAQGLVNGLASQQAALTKQMIKLADTMVDELKKKLKIKSPSMLMHEEIGVPTAQGILQGFGSVGFGDAAQGAVDGLTAAAMHSGMGGGGDLHATIDLGEGIQVRTKVAIGQHTRALKARAMAGSRVGNYTGK